MRQYSKDLAVTTFFSKFPTDEACLEHLMRTRYGVKTKCPKCWEISKFHRAKKSPAYVCQWCGHHIHPMADTPFHKSHMPLQKWFYVLHLFTTTRHGVPAKELQRQLGVTYKTAWRISHQIREYMAEISAASRLDGHVEIDETYIGGKEKGPVGRSKSSKKAIVFGIVQRGGDVHAEVVPSVRMPTLYPIIKRRVSTNSTVSTDAFTVYEKLYRLHLTKHGAVNHSAGQYVDGIHHTQTIEGFWSIIKRSIRGTHVHVSKKHLPKYLGEFCFRFNLRKHPNEMLDLLLSSF